MLASPPYRVRETVTVQPAVTGAAGVVGDDGGPPPLRPRDLAGLGGLLSGCVVAGLGIGWLVDSAAGTEPAFTLVGLFLGVAAGLWATWLRVRDVFRQ